MDHTRPLWQWIIICGLPILLVYSAVRYDLFSNIGSGGIPLPSLPSIEQVVTYTDSGFSPDVLTIKKGTVTTFKNASTRDMRIAANPHPLHDSYPTRGGCISSTFDSCTDIPPGGSWSFQFDFVGSWGYHNHLNFSDTGTIIVQ